jgi:hypothetical protein
MDTVGKHLMDNGKHHSFRRWRGPRVRDDSDDEWDDHVRSGEATFLPRPVDANVGLHMLFENVNAIPPTNVPQASATNAAERASWTTKPPRYGSKLCRC